MMKLDQYTYCARLLPALIVSMPFLILLFITLPVIWKLIGALSAMGVSVALIFLMAQCGRDAGKRKEPDLFRTIGGKPSTRLLRHSDQTLPPATKKRYHDFLAANAPGFNPPTPQQEASDPDAADRMYDSALDWLRAKTRDTKLHDLLFAENISYGFRRNLWGMKPLGVATCLFGALVIAGLFFGVPSLGMAPPIAAATLMIIVIQICFWVWVIKPRWVALPAEAYAKTLLEFCDK